MTHAVVWIKIYDPREGFDHDGAILAIGEQNAYENCIHYFLQEQVQISAIKTHTSEKHNNTLLDTPPPSCFVPLRTPAYLDMQKEKARIYRT
jgi:hypothetical protein